MGKIQMRQFGLRGGRVRNVDLKKKKGIRVQDKRPFSCLWATLGADSCFNKTLTGGSGYQVPADKKQHHQNRKRSARGPDTGMHVHDNILQNMR